MMIRLDPARSPRPPALTPAMEVITTTAATPSQPPTGQHAAHGWAMVRSEGEADELETSAAPPVSSRRCGLAEGDASLGLFRPLPIVGDDGIVAVAFSSSEGAAPPRRYGVERAWVRVRQAFRGGWPASARCHPLLWPVKVGLGGGHALRRGRRARELGRWLRRSFTVPVPHRAPWQPAVCSALSRGSIWKDWNRSDPPAAELAVRRPIAHPRPRSVAPEWPSGARMSSASICPSRGPITAPSSPRYARVRPKAGLLLAHDETFFGPYLDHRPGLIPPSVPAAAVRRGASKPPRGGLGSGPPPTITWSPGFSGDTDDSLGASVAPTRPHPRACRLRST